MDETKKFKYRAPIKVAPAWPKDRVADICIRVNQRHEALEEDDFRFIKSLRGAQNIPADMLPRIERVIKRETERRDGGGGGGGGGAPAWPRERVAAICRAVNQQDKPLSNKDFRFIQSLRGDPRIPGRWQIRIERVIKRETERRDRLIRILRTVNQQHEALEEGDFQFLESLRENPDIQDDMRRRIVRAIANETERRAAQGGGKRRKRTKRKRRKSRKKTKRRRKSRKSKKKR